MNEKIKLGISACLLGKNVRYNGGHAHDHYLTETLGQWVDYVPVCPEVECGLPVPRETMRLVGDPDNPVLMTNKTKKDMTAQMKNWAKKRVRELEKEHLCGFIFKSKSPSSGLYRVKIYTEQGMPANQGVGIWARIFTENSPLLPVEEEGRLHDPGLRENFIQRIFVFKRWQEVLKKGKTRGNLVDFHTRHKLLLLSHNQKNYREMGKLVASSKDVTQTELFERYVEILNQTMMLKTTRPKNVNVLIHIMGYFKKMLPSDEKQELLEIINQYKKNYLPLVVPITLLNHYVRKYDVPYLASQVYMNPHPIELGLRNQA
ncbi:MAG: DUF523 and DUF1722 domain-containing protein [Desulfobacteraceae bacterium]|jgi:uncharacterized protein YbgA (DUF1722 family)/uncharacterized protein YbbK (DUF523 family)|nr:DUF523 and DUF1722 domain-containing protein [Desulfobacteraceae bacterium]